MSDTKFVENVIKKSKDNITCFKGGRIRHYLDQWKALTSDHEILQIVQGLKLDFSTVPFQEFIPKQIDFNAQEICVVNLEINKLLEKGVIVESMYEYGQFISTVFLRPKKDGTHRLILNLKNLNKFINYHHF